MMLTSGQKVVCIGLKGSPKPPGFWEAWRKDWGLTFPKRGEVYTVRETAARADGGQRIRLVEIVNPHVEFTDAPKQEPWWWSEGFRPVVDRPTDISMFTALLKPALENA